MHRLLFFTLLLLTTFSSGIRWGSENEGRRDESKTCDITEISELLRRSSPVRPMSGLRRRQSGGDDSGGDSVGVALGNTTVKAKLGNINITVQNVTISTGNIAVENITIGNITVLVNVNLAELGKLLPIGNLTLPSLPSVSLAITLATETSASTAVPATTTVTTVTPTVTSTADANQNEDSDRIRRDGYNMLLGPRQTSLPSLPSASVDVSTGDINVDAEIGNITLSVQHINVTIGDVEVKNISIGNILVLINLGTNSDLSNLTNLAARNL